MSYIPSPEKMTSLGFDNKFQLGPRIWLGPMKEGGYIKVITPIAADGKVKLAVTDEDEDRKVMFFDLPSEEFFDQLLAAVGVRIRPR